MKYSNCPHCGGKLRSESIGWKCGKCQGFIDMQGNFHEHIEKPFLPPMTNADLIRAMSDEELAKFLHYFNERICEHCSYEMKCTSKCIGGVKKWLQQPAEEVDHGK